MTSPGSFAARSTVPSSSARWNRGDWWRETPVAGPVGDGIVEGFIDLLFKEEDGFVIVDYKTDALGTEDEIERAMARYRLQGGGYALALSRATGANVKEVSFLFLEPSRAVTVEDLSGAMKDRRGRGSRLVCGRSCPMMTRGRLNVRRLWRTAVQLAILASSIQTTELTK